MVEAQQRGWKIYGQEEIGENGTPHLQLMVKTPQVRFPQVKRVFPRAHIEPARNVTALRQYVEKEETRVGGLPAANNQALYPNVEELYRRYIQWLWIPQVMEEDEEPVFPTLLSFIRHMSANHDVFDDYVIQCCFEYINVPKGEDKISKWKSFLSKQIEEGNHVDQLAVNPQVISYVKTYTVAMLMRALKQLWDLHASGR